MTAWYATQDPDPREDSAGYTQDLITAGINCARGTAAGTIAGLIFQDHDYLEFFRPHLETMVQDPSPAVRAMVAHTLLASLRYDRDFAVARFVELCDDGDVLPTHYVEQFLRYGVQTHFGELEPILSRMLSSNNDDVAKVGARQSCVASLTVDEALSWGRQCAAGSKPLRLGAAEVYAANLRYSALRAECEAMLVQLFNDPDDDVRKTAASCFRHFDGRELDEYTDLSHRYVESLAFTLEFNPLIKALDETTANVSELIVAACERFFDLAAGEMSNLSAINARTTANLVVRAYSQTTDDQIRSRCLDLIDRMYVMGAYHLDRVMEDIDR